MGLDAAFINWDADRGDVSGNAWHIAPIGLTKAEVEGVIRDGTVPVERSRSSGRPCKTGALPDGRRVRVVWDVLSDRPPVVYPVTADEVP